MNVKMAFVVLALAVITAPQTAIARTSSAVLALQPSKGAPTTVVQASGSGFAPGETVALTFDATAVGSATSDGGGAFTTTFTVPASATPGKHLVTATGQTSGLHATHRFTVLGVDWPAARYSPARTGANPFESLIDTGNVGTLTNAWASGNLGAPVTGGAVEVKGIVYIADDGTDVWAFDATTGAVNWHTVIPTVFCCQMSDLTVDKGMVFGSFSKEVWALSAASGAVIWHTCDYTQGTCEMDSAVSAPTVAGGKVFAGSEMGNLYALSESTGSVIWKDSLSGNQLDAIEAAPAVDVASKILYVQDDSNRFYAIKTSTGAVRWTGNRATIPLPVGGFTENTPSPALAGGTVYVASSVDGNLTAFPAAGCGQATCNPLWTATMHGSFGSPAVADGRVFVAAETPDRSLFSIMAVDAATGTELWNTGVVPEGSFGGEEGPTVENGVVYANNGHAYGFDAADGSVLWTTTIGGGPSTPVVVNGRVFIGSGNDQQLLSFKLP